MTRKRKERRKTPRIPVRVNIEFWENAKVEKKAKGFIKNISLEGMCIETSLNSFIGNDLIFSLILPDKLRINIYGKIIWQKREADTFRYGIKFTQLDISEKPKLYRFVLVTLFLSEKR